MAQHIDHSDRLTTVQKLRSFGAHWASEVAEWQVTGEKGTEKKYAQSFWSDLLDCFGINAARQRLFEREAKRASTGNHGWIDFFMSGVAIGEAKSVGFDLAAAFEQVDDYLAGGAIKQSEFPRYAILSNFGTIHIQKLDDHSSVVAFSIDDIANHYDDLVFLIGLDVLSHEEEEKASIHAANLMAQLYVAVLGDEDADEGVGDATPTNPEDEDIREAETSILMTRLLFLLYGDDAGLWERDLFYRWVEQDTTPAGLGAQLGQLFSILNTPVNRRSRNMGDLMSKFPYVNGALFEDSLPAEFFTYETREALLEACRFQWTSISVSVFGAMFQLVKSKEARRAAGEHYTSETNILKTVGPLFLNHYQEKAGRLIRNKGTLLKDFDALLEDMASNIYCDPACGSGNFLNLAYARLREIETSIIVEKRRRFASTGGENVMTLLIEIEQKLSIGQFYGFEIGWWPAKIAETSMFLVDHQANQKLAKAIGVAPERLPINISAHIHHGNALRVKWDELLPIPKGKTYIFGNPPFLGDHTRTAEQLSELQDVWGSKQLSRLDYVTGWHKKSLDLFRNRAGEFAFVTTNSITQGDQTARLFAPIFDAGWHIKFAHRTFAWDSQAPGQAAVHCVIVGFTKDVTEKPRLWDYEKVNGSPVEAKVQVGINAYLVDGPDILVEKRSRVLSPALGKISYGSKPADDGNFVVSEDDYADLSADPIISKYLRPYIGSAELIKGIKRWCIWLVDIEPGDMAKSPELRRRIDAVMVARAKSTAKSTREYEYHHLFRQLGFTSDVPFIGIPEVSSSNRRFLPVRYLSPETIISNKVYGAVDEDGLLGATPEK